MILLLKAVLNSPDPGHRGTHCVRELEVPKAVPQLNPMTPVGKKICDYTIACTEYGKEILDRGPIEGRAPHCGYMFLHMVPGRLWHEEKAARPLRSLVLEPRVADCNKDPDNRKRTHIGTFDPEALNHRRRQPRAIHSQGGIRNFRIFSRKGTGTPAGGPRLAMGCFAGFHHITRGEAGLVAVAAQDLAAGEAFATPHLQAVSTQLRCFDGSSSMPCIDDASYEVAGNRSM